jgi:hypothetical protein
MMNQNAGNQQVKIGRAGKNPRYARQAHVSGAKPDTAGKT